MANNIDELEYRNYRECDSCDPYGPYDRFDRYDPCYPTTPILGPNFAEGIGFNPTGSLRVPLAPQFNILKWGERTPLGSDIIFSPGGRILFRRRGWYNLNFTGLLEANFRLVDPLAVVPAVSMNFRLITVRGGFVNRLGNPQIHLQTIGANLTGRVHHEHVSSDWNRTIYIEEDNTVLIIIASHVTAPGVIPIEPVLRDATLVRPAFSLNSNYTLNIKSHA